MSDDHAPDLIRWTFTIDPARLAEVVGLLNDHGLHVHDHGDGLLVATWDEPEGDPDELIEALWEVHGAPFEVTHESFRRLEHLAYHLDEDAADQAAA